MFSWLNLSIVHRELIQNISDSVSVAETGKSEKRIRPRNHSLTCDGLIFQKRG
jgi:hypothetical protein